MIQQPYCPSTSTLVSQGFGLQARGTQKYCSLPAEATQEDRKHLAFWPLQPIEGAPATVALRSRNAGRILKRPCVAGALHLFPRVGIINQRGGLLSCLSLNLSLPQIKADAFCLERILRWAHMSRNASCLETLERDSNKLSASVSLLCCVKSVLGSSATKPKRGPMQRAKAHTRSP